MTDDELQSCWASGKTLDEIAVLARKPRGTITSTIRRRRDKEGPERWPRRASPIKPNPRHTPKRIRSGTSTLPPLASLEGHGETPRR